MMHGFPKWGPGEHEGNERYRSFSLKRLSLPSSPSLLGEKLAKNLYFYLTRASASTVTVLYSPSSGHKLGSFERLHSSPITYYKFDYISSI